MAVEFGKIAKTVGFDINVKRLEELRSGFDRTGEVSRDELQASAITFTNDLDELRSADFHIVAVPTPVDDANQPDLSPMLRASETVGKALKSGDIVVYESTVYPGATEENCVPILEKFSGLRCGREFKVGYSPERINPGDKEHRFTSIRKVVSGQDKETLDIVADVYGSVVTAGVFKARSIKVAEAAKVIENTQRDLNIALMNELVLIFDRMDISIYDVLAAAETKWNFLKFKPGLVGGHCIGVDPYYLTQKAERLDYHPEVILAGRRVNDGMGAFIAQRTVKDMIHAGQNVRGCRVTILGLTFKEDCNDLRNSKVADIIRELQSFGIEVQVHDPLADAAEAKHEYGVVLKEWSELKPAKAVIAAVAHKQYRALQPQSLAGLCEAGGVLLDIKAMYEESLVTELGISYRRI